MRIQAQTIGKPRASRNEKLPTYEKWEAYLAEFVDSAPDGLENAFQFSGVFWAFMVSEKAFF